MQTKISFHCPFQSPEGKITARGLRALTGVNVRVQNVKKFVRVPAAAANHSAHRSVLMPVWYCLYFLYLMLHSSR